MWIGGFVNGNGVRGINISLSIIHGILVVFHVACDISWLLFASCHFVRAETIGIFCCITENGRHSKVR